MSNGSDWSKQASFGYSANPWHQENDSLELEEETPPPFSPNRLLSPPMPSLPLSDFLSPHQNPNHMNLRPEILPSDHHHPKKNNKKKKDKEDSDQDRSGSEEIEKGNKRKKKKKKRKAFDTSETRSELGYSCLLYTSDAADE